jgi:tyrosyl-DNA phosphodiesterase-1
MVWLQDIPKRDTPIARDSKVVDDFPTMFQRVLHALNVRPALQNLLRNEVRSIVIVQFFVRDT